jgi:metal-responsive CopG/Arc/MetJ family transcriptional regulator
MRTTVDLPDTLFREVKSTAARQGESLKEFLQRAVVNELSRAWDHATAKRVVFPVLDSAQPGSLNPTNDEIDRMLA